MKALSPIFKELKQTLIALDEALTPVSADRRAESASLRAEMREKEGRRNSILQSLMPNAGQVVSEKDIRRFIEQTRTELESRYGDCQTQIVCLNRQMDDLRKQLADKAQLLANVEATLQELELQQKALKREIDGRFILVDIWKSFFGDPERDRLAKLGEEILQRCNQSNDIKSERDNLNRQLVGLKCEVSDNEQKLNECSAELLDCQKRLRRLKEVEKLNDEIEYLRLRSGNCVAEIEEAQRLAKERKNNALLKLDALCKDIREIQPQLASLSPQAFGVTEEVCDMMAFGRIRLCAGEKKIGYLPRLIPFPCRRALLFGKTQLDRQWVADFLLRAFQCIPAAQLSLTAIDPREVGKSLPDFQILLKNDRPFPAKRILTRADEIEAALDEHLRYVEELIQHVFVGGIRDWSDYNRVNHDNPLAYKLLIIFDLPEQLSDRSAIYLSRLVQHGPRCGVLPLLSCSREAFDERKHAALLDILRHYTWRNAEIYKHSSFTALWRQLSFTEEPEPTVKDTVIRDITIGLEEKFRLAGRFKGAMLDLWKSDVLWSANATEGLEADVGWTSQGNMPVRFRLGDNPAHALFGGKTGTGKSNFIHVLLHSLCHRYSPKELEVYLLDYKEGVEFNCYANPMLPHARLVATESDIEYGIAALQHLKLEYQRRAAVFKQLGVRDYKGYREQGNDGMPRTLVIIDEFQKLFDGDRMSSELAEQLLVTLLKQARAAGIHIVLSTQTVRGLLNQSVSGLIGQLGCRLALSCSVDDSNMLLGSGNDAAASLHSPPEGILNFENGTKSANIRFCIPFADEAIRRQKQLELADERLRRGYKFSNIVFNGKTLPKLPSKERFAELATSPGLPLLLGETHDFAATPFIVDVVEGGLLVAGFNPQVRSGLINTLVGNLTARPEAKVIYYSTRRNPSIRLDTLPANFIYKDATWDLADFETLLAENPGINLVVDTFDYARRFVPAGIGSYRKPGTPDTPWDILKRYADPLEEGHAQVFLFVENYRRFSGLAKELFNLFDLRIGFGLDEDEAGNLVSGSVAKLKGLQDLSKAVFINRNEGGKPVFFRPFAN